MRFKCWLSGCNTRHAKPFACTRCGVEQFSAHNGIVHRHSLPGIWHPIRWRTSDAFSWVPDVRHRFHCWLFGCDRGTGFFAECFRCGECEADKRSEFLFGNLWKRHSFRFARALRQNWIHRSCGLCNAHTWFTTSDAYSQTHSRSEHHRATCSWLPPVDF